MVQGTNSRIGLGMSILRKDEVVQRHAKEYVEEINASKERLNLLLSKTPEMPVRVASLSLGSNLKVREEMCRQLKEAGWRITHFVDEKEGKDEYILE